MRANICYALICTSILLLVSFSKGIWLNPQYCYNGDKPVPHCLHSQSGLCKTTNASQPCIGSDRYHGNNKDEYYKEAASCSLDYIAAKDCESSDWPIYKYEPHVPPFRLVIYRHFTWMMSPRLALNLSLAADSPTGVKFYFQHQRDAKRQLCRKFTIIEPIGYFIDEEYNEEYGGNSAQDNVGDAIEAEYKENDVLDKTDGLKSASGESSQSSQNDDSNILSNSVPTASALNLIGGNDSMTNSVSYQNKLNTNFSSPKFTRLLNRRKRNSLPHILFWDCLMFQSSFEGEDYFLRLTDDAGWGAQLSFRVPTIENHDRYVTPVKDWSVFFYVHLEHVTLEASVPVTFQAAPFPLLKYNVSLHHACCSPSPANLTTTNDGSHSNSSDDCRQCGSAIASIIVHGPKWSREEAQESDAVLTAILPYQSTLGSYLVTIQIQSPECGPNQCYTAISPVFHVYGGGYGSWVVVTVVVLILLFLLSFTVMALIIRSQAEVASKKLCSRPHLLLVSCPYSLSSLSLINSLSSFLHHTAAVATSSIHSHLADADPYQWMLYELSSANKVVFLLPPAGKTVTKYSQVPQQWRLGVLCFSAMFGMLSNSPSKHKHKFALLTVGCSGPPPPELCHLQRFNLLEDMVTFVTWLHDGTILDRWFLWHPLVTHKETSSVTGTPYRSNKSKKNSIAWSGFKREAPATEEQEAPEGAQNTMGNDRTLPERADQDAPTHHRSLNQNEQAKIYSQEESKEGRRPEWVAEVLADKDERVTLPVVQNAFAPTFSHLEAAVKIVELEEEQRPSTHQAAQSDAVPRVMVTRHNESCSTYLRKLLHRSARKKRRRNPEESDLCDNSVSSNITVSSAATHLATLRQQCVNDAMGVSDSCSTLNNIMPLQEMDFGEAATESVAVELSDVECMGGVPGVAELALLGESELVSPNTDTSSCQVEDDDDDFTTMLFGGTVNDE